MHLLSLNLMVMVRLASYMNLLFTLLNLESPCVAFLCRQQNKTSLKDHFVLTSFCHALLLLLPLLFWGIHWCALRNLIYVDYFVRGLFLWSHFVNIVAAFRGMHVSPAKHSYMYAWLPRKCDYRTDRWTDAGQSDPYVPLCFAGDTKTILIQCHGIWKS